MTIQPLPLRKKAKLEMAYESSTYLQRRSQHIKLFKLLTHNSAHFPLIPCVKSTQHSLSALFTVGHCVGVLPLSGCLCTGLIAGDHTTSVRVYSGGHYTLHTHHHHHHHNTQHITAVIAASVLLIYCQYHTLIRLGSVCSTGQNIEI